MCVYVPKSRICAHDPPRSAEEAQACKMQLFLFFASHASSARPNMPVSRFMKRNSHGNPKTVLKTLTDTDSCDKTWIFCYCHHITGKHLTVGDFGGFLPFFAIDIGPNMLASRFLKRNSPGNQKTVLKTPTNTYFCDKTWIFCYCRHITGPHPLVVLQFFAIDIGPNMLVSRFLKRNSPGNPKTMLKTRVPTDTCFCDKTSLFCYCHHNAREPPVKGAKCIMLVVLPSFAIYIGPNLPLSRFLKRNSSGNPKTVLKTPTDTYFCDKMWIFSYCHHTAKETSHRAPKCMILVGLP